MIFEQPGEIAFSLPSWVSEYSREVACLESIEARTNFVIEASRLNVHHQTGGPFAAAIFEVETGKLMLEHYSLKVLVRSSLML